MPQSNEATDPTDNSESLNSDSAAVGSRCLFVAPPGWGAVLSAEVARTFAPASVEVSGLDQIFADVHAAPPEAALAFCAQILPRVEPVSAASINNWVRAIAPAIVDKLRDHNSPWRLHVFALSGEEGASSGRRILLHDSLLDFLKKKQRRLVRSVVYDNARPLEAGEAIVQIALAAADRGCFSVSRHVTEGWLPRCVSRFPGGVLKVPVDREAPSRAYQKLKEVQLRMGHWILPGESCVDLGASPGGWTHEAILRGAKVVAVDRSPLREDLMRSAQVKFVRGDAFQFEPSEPVDWLLSDVVAFPPRIIELLKTWIGKQWCRRFCVTMKFRGDEDYPLVDEVKALLYESGCAFCVKRMQSNKNEVMIYGSLDRSEFVGC